MLRRGLDIDISSDERGLPSVAVSGDDGFAGGRFGNDRRTLRITETGPDGALAIDFSAPWRFRGPRRLWLPPLAAVAGFFGVALGIEHGLGIRPYHVQGTIWEPIGYGAVLAGAVLSSVGCAWLYYRHRFGHWVRRPWHALQGFSVTDSSSLYGDGSRTDAARPRAHVIRAEFGTAWPSFEVISTQKSLAEVAELHRVLTLLFVEQKLKMVRRSHDSPLPNDGDVPGKL